MYNIGYGPARREDATANAEWDPHAMQIECLK